jgi:Fic family protein
MMTLRRLAQGTPTVPAATAWYLSDLGTALGKQELFTRQTPQKLKALREHALIESAISSNRIEGVEVEQERVGTLMFGKPTLRDRNEEEVRGYRDALRRIHEQGSQLPISEDTIQQLHRTIRGSFWDAGQYKDQPSDIIERHPNGRTTVRFRTVSPKDTPASMTELVELWQRGLKERWLPPLCLLAAFNLDFLCIHPFRDGNGRVSRLLLLLQCYHLGYEVGRYISLERLIEQHKERYYETLRIGSQSWHKGEHDPWPYIHFILATLRDAYQEFEARVGQTPARRGEKAELVLQAIARQKGEFRVRDLEAACPGVGREWIRLLLTDLRKQGKVRCHGRGPAARWTRVE